MSKKYKHKPPHNPGTLEMANNKLSTRCEELRTENETLQTALRLLTSADKSTLLESIKNIEDTKKFADNVWYTMDTSQWIATGTGTIFTDGIGVPTIIGIDPAVGTTVITTSGTTV